MPNVSAFKGPSCRRYTASGQAVIRLTARDVYLGKYGSAASRGAYKRFAAEYLERGGVFGNRRGMTVAEIMAAYLRFANECYRKNVRPTREYELIRETCRFIRPLYPRVPAEETLPAASCISSPVVNALDGSITAKRHLSIPAAKSGLQRQSPRITQEYLQ